MNLTNRLVTESSQSLAPGQKGTIYLASKSELKEHIGMALRFKCESELVYIVIAQ